MQPAFRKPSRGLFSNRAHRLCPTSCWLANEGAGTIAQDTGRFADHARWMGLPTWSAGPAGHNALSGFSGSNYLTTTRYPRATYSLVGRFRLDSTGNTGFNCLFAASDGSGYTLHLWTTNRFQLWTASEYAGLGLGSVIANDAWVWFAITRAGNSITNGYSLYYDGVLDAQVNTTAVSLSANPYWLGMRSDSFPHPWVGAIDYLLWYDWCLSPADVQALYRDPFPWVDSPARFAFSIPSVTGPDAMAFWGCVAA